MGELADYLCDHIGPGLTPDDLSLWNKIVPSIKYNGLEAALLEQAPTATLELVIAAETGAMISARERQVFADVFAGNKKLRLSRLIKHILKPQSGIPIVTTNYDRLVEVAVEEAGIGADTMFIGRFAGTLNEKESRLSFCRQVTLKKRNNVCYRYQARALVFKPHGSLDWYLRDGKPVCYAGDISNIPRLIITPGHNKFRNGYESPFDHHRSRANEAIDRASRFLIIGYGFNDDHLETHLSPAIRGGKPTLMLTYELSPAAVTLAMSCTNVVALDHSNQGGRDGTRVIIGKVQLFYPDLMIWDLHSFVTEVLEP